MAHIFVRFSRGSAASMLLLFTCAALLGASRGRGPAMADEGWQSLFDGKSLGQWKSTEFGGEGKVTVANGQINLEAGVMLTGITWTGSSFPKTNFEVSLEAKKVDGTDFFCGLTFPVAESHCSLILGGWGGGIVGLSSLDGWGDGWHSPCCLHHQRTRWHFDEVTLERRGACFD